MEALLHYFVVINNLGGALASPVIRKTSTTMDVRIKYKSAAAAEKAASKLPVGCRFMIVKDRTTDAYLQIPEDYEDYVMRYLNPKDY